MYRFLVLCLERRPRYRRQSRLMSMIPPSAFSDDINDEEFGCSVRDPDEPSMENSKDIGRKSSLKPKETVDDPKIKRKVRKNGTHKISSRNRYFKSLYLCERSELMPFYFKKVRSKKRAMFIQFWAFPNSPSKLDLYSATQQKKNPSNCMMIWIDGKFFFVKPNCLKNLSNCFMMSFHG